MTFWGTWLYAFWDILFQIFIFIEKSLIGRLYLVRVIGGPFLCFIVVMMLLLEVWLLNFLWVHVFFVENLFWGVKLVLFLDNLTLVDKGRFEPGRFYLWIAERNFPITEFSFDGLVLLIVFFLFLLIENLFQITTIVWKPFPVAQLHSEVLLHFLFGDCNKTFTFDFIFVECFLIACEVDGLEKLQHFLGVPLFDGFFYQRKFDYLTNGIVFGEEGGLELFYLGIFFLEILQIFTVEPFLIQNQSRELLFSGQRHLFNFLVDQYSVLIELIDCSLVLSIVELSFAMFVIIFESANIVGSIPVRHFSLAVGEVRHPLAFVSIVLLVVNL